MAKKLSSLTSANPAGYNKWDESLNDVINNFMAENLNKNRDAISLLNKPIGFNTASMDSTVGGAITAASLLDDMYKNLQSKDIQQRSDSYINDISNSTLSDTASIGTINNNNDLMNYIGNYSPISTPKIQNNKSGQSIKNIASGALAGTSVLPGIGTAIGAAVGGLTSLIGGIGRSNKIKKAQNQMNSATNKYNNIIGSTINNQISKVDSINDKNAMSNYFAFGGDLIPTLSGAIGYELANKDLGIQNLFAINSAKSAAKLADGGFTHGGLFSAGVDFINEGKSHNENRLGGVPLGVDQEGNPNLVEEGEVRWNDYIFSKRLKLDDVDANNNYINKKYVDKSFADIATKIYNETSERPNDPISKATLNDSLQRLLSAQESERTAKEVGDINSFAFGGDINNWLQAAPIIGAGISTLSDIAGLTNNNDYSHVNEINPPGPTPLISPERITNYMSYVPLDRDYYLNRQRSQTAATRSAVSNASNGNRGALMNTLAAVDFNSNIAEGALARQAAEADINQQMQVENFNRATNMFNSQQSLQAAAQNSEAYRYDARVKAEIEMQKAQMKQQIDMYDQSQRDANLSNFAANLGALGKERIAMNAIMSNSGLYYYWDKNGNINYKNGYEKLTPSQKAVVDADAQRNKPTNSKACGGHLNIK